MRAMASGVSPASWFSSRRMEASGSDHWRFSASAKASATSASPSSDSDAAALAAAAAASESCTPSSALTTGSGS